MIHAVGRLDRLHVGWVCVQLCLAKPGLLLPHPYTSPVPLGNSCRWAALCALSRECAEKNTHVNKNSAFCNTDSYHCAELTNLKLKLTQNPQLCLRKTHPEPTGRSVGRSVGPSKPSLSPRKETRKGGRVTANDPLA